MGGGEQEEEEFMDTLETPADLSENQTSSAAVPPKREMTQTDELD